MKIEKRIAAALLAAVMTAAGLMTVFAAPSPIPHPIVRYRLIITPYSQYETIMDEPSRKQMPIAYSQVAVPDLYKYFPMVEEAARQMNLDPASCYAGDLFDATYYSKEEGGSWIKTGFMGEMTVQLPCAAPERFVCVLHYHDEVWSMVDGVQVDYQGKMVSLQVDSLSPFAVIVSDGDVPHPTPDPKGGGDESDGIITSPQTGYDLVTETYLSVKEWFLELLTKHE